MNSSYLNVAAGAFLGVVFVLMTVSLVSEGIFDSPEPAKEGFAIEVADAPAAGEGAAPAAAEITPIGPLLASADVAKGEQIFKKCAACHSNDPSGANKVGPGLWDVVNRHIGTHADFNYSSAMKEFSDGGAKVWDDEHLNHFLLAPKKYIPGTAMGFAGLKKDDERADVIAYLHSLAETPVPLPTN